MSNQIRYIVFPASREEFSSLLEYEQFLRDVVPGPQRNGIYHIRTKKTYKPMGEVPVGSIVVFRIFGSHLGHARVQVGLRPQFEASRRELYPYYITFEPSSVTLFPKKLSMDDFRGIYHHSFYPRNYLDMTSEEYVRLARAAGSEPL